MRTLLFLAVTFTLSVPSDPEPALRSAMPDPGRVGQVFDTQGRAWVRPVGRERWSPLRQRMPLAPGDLVRVDPRGANALEIELDGGRKLVLGPGTLLECTSASAVHVHAGELEVEAPAEHPLAVTGSAGYRSELRGKHVLRAEDKRTGTLPAAPRWLQGYRASTTNEWLGSLLAKVDGRDVPLHVGFHKVDVVVKDQVAETTIEESFVNSTTARLEGTFRFPLPADASISGFGMWIGNEYVEADVVEKQRARQIYEDILQRRKDPGLLEWNGGNLFTARVFPIEAMSEKRIRIRYTQVLPLHGDEMRYRYALRSDLLRQHPLRQLSIRVSTSSSTPIADATCTTHAARIRKTERDAVIEYDATEVTPERDFEARIVLSGSEGARLVTHRRGEDGYFMLLFGTSPGKATGVPRELVPEGEPLHFVIVADTSGSVRRKEREAQAAFVRGLLAMLTPKDRFELWSCDVVVQKHAPEPLTVDADHVEKALTWLDRRASLGWTDLDRAFAEVRRSVPANAVVIYLGDGVTTAGDADPVAFAQRIRAAHAGQATRCHAIALGASYEEPVLATIAALGGGGSMRHVGEDAVGCAVDLLAEVAQPTLVNARLEFEGLRTAAVYPERLPNLPTGRQQVVLGRFLPSAQRQTVRAHVRGTLAGKPVSFTTEVTLDPGEAGNSFLPRSWARRHLDALLAQGRAKAVQEEIVAFSTEFCIMTPYTSLLVLESDEDRERYGVARRVKMRDGERFFAEARDQTSLAVKREQMRLASAWRVGFRERALRRIAGLGKELHGAEPGHGVVVGFTRAQPSGRGVAKDTWSLGPTDQGTFGESFAKEEEASSESVARDSLEDLDDAEAIDLPATEATRAGEVAEESELMDRLEDKRFRGGLSRRSGLVRKLRADDAGFSGWGGLSSTVVPQTELTLEGLGFPWLAASAEPTSSRAELAELEALLVRMDLQKRAPSLAGGVTIQIDSVQIDTARRRTVRGTRTVASFGALGWRWRSGTGDAFTQEQWLAQGQRGVLDLVTELGRTRAALGSDATACPLDPYGGLVDELRRNDPAWRTSWKELDSDTVEIRRELLEARLEAVVIRIDRARAVPLERTVLRKGVATSTTRWTDFVEVAGTWLPTRTERSSAGDATLAVQTLSARAAPADELARELAECLASHARALFVPASNPALAASKQARHERKADVAHLLVIACHFASMELWDDALAALAEAEAKAGERFATRWLTLRILQRARRGEAAKALALRLAEECLTRGALARFFATSLSQEVAQVLGNREALDLWRTLRPAFEGAGADGTSPLGTWRARAATLHEALGQHAEALALCKENVAAEPDELAHHGALVALLVRQHDARGALDHLAKLLAEPKGGRPELFESLRHVQTDLAFGRLPPHELRDLCLAWTRSNPKSAEAWTRYGSALLFAGEEPVADAWISERLASAGGLEDDAEYAATHAALSLALGHGWGFWQRAIDPRWHAKLASFAIACLGETEPRAGEFANRVLSDGRFRATDAGRQVVAHIRAQLATPGLVATIPLPRLRTLLDHVPMTKEEIAPELWESIRAGLEVRIRAAGGSDAQDCREVLMLACDRRGERALALALQRESFRSATHEERPAQAQALAGRLAAEAWSPAIEEELFAVHQARVADTTAADALALQSGDATRWLADTLAQMRVDAALGPQAEREKLPRHELHEQARSARKAAASALAERFGKARRSAAAPWRHWFALEELVFLAAAGAEPTKLHAEAMEVWGALPHDEGAHAVRVQEARALMTLLWAASRKGAAAELGEATVSLLLAEDRARQGALDWRGYVALLLAAQDRLDRLAALAREWIVPAEAENRWRVVLAHLLAERGDLEGAVSVLEKARAGDEVPAEALRSLEGWSLALGDEARRRASQRRALELTPADTLRTRLWEHLNKVQPRSGMPASKLEAEVFVLLEVLLRKTSDPRNELSLVTSLYRATKDVRVLEAMADGTLGGGPEAVYGFLAGAQTTIADVHEEATLDAIVARARSRRTDARSATDRRALSLLLALCARRAAEVRNQAGPHWEAALAEVRKASEGAYGAGERQPLATFLAALGTSGERAFTVEVVARIEHLLGLAETAAERLAIATSLANFLWANERTEDAMLRLESALSEYAKSGLEAGFALDNVALLAGWLEARGRFAAAETLLLAWRARAAPTFAARFDARCWELFLHCLRAGGTLSLGRGQALYEALIERNRAELAAADRESMAIALERFRSLHATAHEAKLARVVDHVVGATRGVLADLWKRMPQEAGSSVAAVGTLLERFGASRDAARLVIERIENEPAWLERVERGTWTQTTWSLAEWRAKGALGAELENRLLRIVLRALEADLMTLGSTSHPFTHQNYSHVWREKRGEFLTVARRVLELRAGEPAVVRHVAETLWHHLGARPEAIGALLGQDARRPLAHDYRLRLVEWLFEARRHAEALPHADLAIAEVPAALPARLFKVRILQALGRSADARSWLAATADLSRKDGSVAVDTLAQLGALAFECGFWEPCVAFQRELIAILERTQSHGKPARAEAWTRLGGALSKLGQHPQAVDAAAAAVVLWPDRSEERRAAIAGLASTLADVPDLTSWVTERDAAVLQSGEDSALLRKLCGRLFAERSDLARARAELTKSLELQPVDRETHDLRIDVARRAGSAVELAAALRHALEHFPAELAYSDALGDAALGAGDAAEAERAFTNGVECLPGEAEGHTQLARRREHQGRFVDAIEQWRHAIRHRTTDPNGWLGLASAQVRAGLRTEAKATVDEVLAKTWEERYGDVRARAREVLNR